MSDPSSIKSQIEYGLDAVSDDRSATLPLKDLLYVYQTIGEIIRFFHQPAHYPTLERVEEFLGSVDSSDGFAALGECYYTILRDCWPADISAKFDNGDFDNSTSPFYCRPIDESDA
jgi:hypothetical protein